MTKSKYLRLIVRFRSLVRCEAISCRMSQRRSMLFVIEQFNLVGTLDIRPSSVGTILSPPLSQLKER